MGDAGLARVIEGTALRRAGVRGLRRNLAVAIGNAGAALAGLVAPQEEAAPEKVPGTSSGGRPSLDDPMVAEHVDWARSQSR
jgi:epoxyqueuosine reductase QueG